MFLISMAVNCVLCPKNSLPFWVFIFPLLLRWFFPFFRNQYPQEACAAFSFSPNEVARVIPCPSSIELDVLLTAAVGMPLGSHAWGSAVLFCLIARFLLTSCNSKRGDYRLLHILPGIRHGHDLSAIILAETLRSLDDVQGRPGSRFSGSPLLLQVSLCF